ALDLFGRAFGDAVLDLVLADLDLLYDPVLIEGDREHDLAGQVGLADDGVLVASLQITDAADHGRADRRRHLDLGQRRRFGLGLCNRLGRLDGSGLATGP